MLEGFLNSGQAFETVETRTGNGRAVLALGGGFCEGERLDAFEGIVRSMADSGIRIDSEEVFALHRVKDGEDFFFLCNPTHTGYPLNIRFKGEHGLERWNLEDGSILPVLELQYEGGDTLVSLPIPAVGSLMLHLVPRMAFCASRSNITLTALEDGSAQGYGRVENRAEAVVNGQALSAPARENLPPFRPEGPWQAAFSAPNALVISRWKFLYDTPGLSAKDLQEKNLENELDMRMGGWSFQLPQEHEQDDYPLSAWFVADFRAEALPGDLKLMIDGYQCDGYELYINGERMADKPERSYLDAEILTVPVRPLKKGRNRIAVRMVLTSPTGGLLDLVKLIGTFTVALDSEGEYIAPPKSSLDYGDWCGQGYPYLAAMVDYTQKVTLPEGFLGQRLELFADVGDDLFEVFINGEPADCRMWQPYTLDITPFVKDSAFTLTVRAVNTIANLLEGARKPSGLRSLSITPCPVYTLRRESRQAAAAHQA